MHFLWQTLVAKALSQPVMLLQKVQICSTVYGQPFFTKNSVIHSKITLLTDKIFIDRFLFVFLTQFYYSRYVETKLALRCGAR